MEVAAVGGAAEIFWLKFQAVFQLPSVTAITCFVLEYTWPGRWLTRRNLALLTVMPLLYVGMILTNDLHHLMWQGFTTHGAVIPLRGPATWFFMTYAYGLSLANVFLFCWLFLRSPLHRFPVAIMLLGQIGARLIYLLEVLGVFPSDLPLDMFMLAYLLLTYAIALFAFRIFDPDQIARNVVISQMRDGMLVLDVKGLVTSLNPAAERIFRVDLGRCHVGLS